MDVLPTLLRSKLAAGPTEAEMEGLQHTLLGAFLGRLSTHQDAQDNYDSFVKEFIRLLLEHLKVRVVDACDQLHSIDLLDAHFVLPWEEGHGVNDPGRALRNNNYVAQVWSRTRYRISRKPADFKEPEPKKAARWEDYVGPDWTPSQLTERKAKHKLSEEKKKRCKVDESDEDSDEDAEEGNGLGSDAESDAGSDAEVGAVEIEDDEDDDSEGTDQAEGAADDGPALVPGTDPSEEELSPEVGLSRHTEEAEEPFFIDLSNYKAYSEVVHESVDDHMVMEMPVQVRSQLCWMAKGLADPTLFFKPYLLGQTFIVNRLLKLCAQEEYIINNRPLNFREDCVQVRCKFYQLSKRYRTNCTLKITLERPSMKKRRGWTCPARFMVEIPHEKPKDYVPLIVMAMAYGWSRRNFVDAVRMFLGKAATKEGPSLSTVNMFLLCLAADSDGCSDQKSAMRRTGAALSQIKSRKLTDPDQILSYVTFTMRDEYMANLIVNDATDKNANHVWENLRKGYMLAQIAAELIQQSKELSHFRAKSEQWPRTDRRSYARKRVDTPGEKMAYLERKYLKSAASKATSSLRKAIEEKKPINLSSILNPKHIKLTNSVKNGIWDSKADASEHNLNKTKMMITGFSSDSFVTQCQNMNKMSQKKNTDPRPLMTHPDQTGRVCLYLTPESERCAMLRNKALGGQIAPLTDPNKHAYVIMQLLKNNSHLVGWIPLKDKPTFVKNAVAVLDVFGGLIGWVTNPLRLYQIVVKYRRSGNLWRFLGIEWDRRRNLFHFCCDEGRILRPLIILDQLPRLQAFVQTPAFKLSRRPVRLLVANGLIEYLDAAEEYCGLVFTAGSLAEAVKHNFTQTHMEVHGTLSLSMLVSNPFCNHNQGPRRMFGGNMRKHPISSKICEDRGTSSTYMLWNGQAPNMSEPVAGHMKTRIKEPAGVNCMVAIKSEDHNIEDSYIMNKAFLDCSPLTTSEISVVTCTLRQHARFCSPDAQVRGRAKPERYRHLGPDGCPRIGAKLVGGDCIVGMVVKRKGMDAERCCSRFLKKSTSCTVKSVTKFPSEAKCNIVHVSLIRTNEPDVGNKFFMSHGQKGTISEIRPSVDMPFIASGPLAGLIPDMITNVHSMTRTTLGLLLEMLWGKARAMSPSLVSQFHTVFLSPTSFRDRQALVTQALVGRGLSYDGKDVMYDGRTGRPIRCRIFTGMVYLGTLKHMAKDKVRSRERGPVNDLTQQPTTGLKNHGGLRLGEMEGWLQRAYGMTATARFSSYESSDKFGVFHCTACNKTAIGCRATGFYHCQVCDTGEHVGWLPINYTTNLMFKELEVAGLGSKIICERA